MTFLMRPLRLLAAVAGEILDRLARGSAFCATGLAKCARAARLFANGPISNPEKESL